MTAPRQPTVRAAYLCNTFGSPDHDRCNALARAGYEINVFDWARSDTQYVWRYSGTAAYRRNVFTVEAGSIVSLVQNALGLFAAMMASRPEFVLIYGYHNLVFFFVAVVTRLLGRRVISINDSKADDYRRPLLSEMIKPLLLSPYSGFLAASERARSYVRQFVARPCELYYCAIDVGRVRVRSASRFEHTKYDERHFTLIARFAEKKNIPTLLEAFERYCATTPNPRRLVICGYGPLEAELKHKIAASPALRDHAELRGFVSVDEVPLVLGSSLALYLPSTEEQFGIVVTEAMAAGIPAVISRQCGAADLVRTSVDGFVLEPDNIDGVAWSMSYLGENEARWTTISRSAAERAPIADVATFVKAVETLTSAKRGKATTAERPHVAIVYHFFPHYRAPVMRALANSGKYRFSFWGDTEGIEGITPFAGDAQVKVQPLKLRRRGRLFSLRGAAQLLRSDADAVIMLGNANLITTWWLVVAARLRGKRALFWAHGWLRRERGPKAWLRRLYFGMAHRTLVYGDRAIQLATDSGFPAARVRAIYNSLDWDQISTVFDELENGDRAELRASITSRPDLPLVAYTGRLTPEVRLDLLCQALAILKKEGMEVALTILGDGPEGVRLDGLTRELGIPAQFIGASYDETVVGRLLYSADIVVAPGKVGLTAIHSLGYGTPVITHDNLDAQMPEVEIIQQSITGDLFKHGDAHSLARTIRMWLERRASRSETRAACRTAVREKWTPESQRALIERALDEVLER